MARQACTSPLFLGVTALLYSFRSHPSSMSLFKG